MSDGPAQSDDNYARWRQIEKHYYIFLARAAARRKDLTTPRSSDDRPADRETDRRGSMAKSSGR